MSWRALFILDPTQDKRFVPIKTFVQQSIHPSSNVTMAQTEIKAVGKSEKTLSLSKDRATQHGMAWHISWWYIAIISAKVYG